MGWGAGGAALCNFIHATRGVAFVSATPGTGWAPSPPNYASKGTQLEHSAQLAPYDPLERSGKSSKIDQLASARGQFYSFTIPRFGKSAENHGKSTVHGTQQYITVLNKLTFLCAVYRDQVWHFSIPRFGKSAENHGKSTVHGTQKC